MRVKEVYEKKGDSFWGLYECQYCGYTFEGGGDDNLYYYNNVVPKIVCPKCKKDSFDDKIVLPNYGGNNG